MRSLHRSFAAILVLGLSASAGVAHAEAPAKSGIPAFDRAVELVIEHFYDPSALDRFRAEVAETVKELPKSGLKSDADIYDPAIDRVLESLNASHTGHFSPDQLDYYELADIFKYNFRQNLRRLFPPEGKITYPGIGIATKMIDGKRFVSDVYDGSTAEKAGIEMGDEILSADGKPFEEIGSFRGKVGKRVALEVRRDATGPAMTIDVPVAELQPSETLVKAIGDSVETIERDGKRIGYVHVWFYADGRVEDALEDVLAGPLKDADALVVDLRSRWGGAPPDAAEIFLGGTQPFRFIDRRGKGSDSNIRWQKPVVAIIDEGTRSGLEVFAYSLKKKGIPLVGTRTAGALLGGRGYMLPDSSLLEIAVAGVEVNGERLEGKGVEPDVKIPFDIRYAAGRDPQRDAALETILPLIL